MKRAEILAMAPAERTEARQGAPHVTPIDGVDYLTIAPHGIVSGEVDDNGRRVVVITLYRRQERGPHFALEQSLTAAEARDFAAALIESAATLERAAAAQADAALARAARK